ncbi:ATP-binding protein [Saccharopolyspora elongata]|uniref:ATP-binding protein n=1 Tax=Saccharopolyspora elongata TaxID=2530387 RepID=UPI001404CE61|nr:ATP-binding protein [Saccharopolyspora elongata]
MTSHLITLTAAVTDGPPAVTLAGGGDRDDRPVRDRVRAGLANSGQPNLSHRVEVRLDPPGSLLPPAAAVAVAVLAVTNGIDPRRLASTAVIGEVGLDGSLRPTRGLLPAIEAARDHGIRQVIAPASALAEAALVDGVDVLGAHSLAEVADWLRGDDDVLRRPGVNYVAVAEDLRPPARLLADPVLLMVEVAAAGGHHVLFDAVDGEGSLLTASWLHQLLPDLDLAQQRDVAAIRSLTGLRKDDAVLIGTPPLEFVHASFSPTTLVGGLTPGVVSRAHHGLLVARSIEEFGASLVEGLRYVLLNRQVSLTRQGDAVRYPAHLQLFAIHTRTSRSQRPPVSLALLDVLDIQFRLTTSPAVASIPAHTTEAEQISQVLAQSRSRIAAARSRAATRWSSTASHGLGAAAELTNAAVPSDVLHSHRLTTGPIDHAFWVGALTLRGADTVVRLAWTAADLDCADRPDRGHVEAALELHGASTLMAARTSRDTPSSQ